MLGIALANRIPVLSLVRDEASREELQNFGAENVLVQESLTFPNDIAEISRELEKTAVFDGVGAEIINRIAPSLPPHTTVYSYGRLGKEGAFSIAWDLFGGERSYP